MTDDKAKKSTLRRLLKEGQIDPRVLARFDLFAELRAAMQRKDKNAQMEIAQKLKLNGEEILAAKAQATTAIATAFSDATATTDLDQRTEKLLTAFALAVKTRYWAYGALSDIELGNVAAEEAQKIADALDAIPPGRLSALTALLDNPDVGVRCMDAIKLRHIMPDHVYPILRKIHEEERGTSVGFSAMQVLPPDPSDPPIPPPVKGSPPKS